MNTEEVLADMVYPVTGKELPELIPGLGIGFTICGSVTLCYLWENGKLRIGAANCGLKEEFKQTRGEKVALRRALAQFDFGYNLRGAIWDHYLYNRGVTPDFSLRVMLLRGQTRRHAPEPCDN